MDALALLTRSAKPIKGRRNNVTSLPSRGAPENPQLYPATQARKRKRGDEGHAGPPLADNGAVDFFSTTHGPSNGLVAPEADADSAAEQDDDEESLAAYTPLQPDARRQLLKQHKLKITLLSSARSTQDTETGERKSKKKKSSKKDTVAQSRDKPSKNDAQISPDPVTDFAHLRVRYGLSRTLAANIEQQGFRVPTEVQLAALPLLLGGLEEQRQQEEEEMEVEQTGTRAVDLLTIAPTGSGKTVAFLVPLLHALSRKGRDTHTRGPRAVVLAPTKELVSQIVNEARKLAVGLGLSVLGVRKGVDLGLDGDGPDAKDRARGIPDVLVGTPIGLLHLLQRKVEQDEADETLEDAAKLRADLPARPLETVEHLVLDEADVLLDPLFKAATQQVWEALTNPHLRVSLWSATISSSVESDIVRLIGTRSRTPAPLLRLVVGLKDSAVPNITHRLTYCATEQGKLMALRELLVPKSTTTSSSGTPAAPLRAPFLVFTQTIPRAVALHQELKYDIPSSAGGASRIAALHSDLPPRARDAILTRFRRGEVWVLITTDLLARGIDLRGVNGVVNYDVPTSAAGYVHRVGRTGRAGREGGVAVTLYSKDDVRWVKVIANVIAAAERARGGGGEGGEKGVQEWLLDALPDVSKKDRRELRTKGVEERRNGRKEARITSKSGFVRREENKRRSMVRSGGSKPADADD